MTPVVRVVARLGAVAACVAVLTAPTFGDSAASLTRLGWTYYTQDATWTLAGSPYVLDDEVFVAAGKTLTIEPGVVVKLNGSLRSLTINGTLRALGTAENRIVFTSYRDDSAGGDSNGDGAATAPAPGQWYAIKIGSGNQSRLRFVDVRYGGWGSDNPSYGALSIGDGGTVTVEDSTFTSNQRSGIIVDSSSNPGGVIVRRSTLSQNGIGISANQGWMRVEERTFVRENRSHGLWFNLTSSFTGPASAVTDSDLRANAGRGVHLQVESGLDVSKWPRGNRNNIFENAGKQLYTVQPKRTADWKHNYWGEGVDYGYAAGGCRFSGQSSVGKLAYRSSAANPPDGPIDSAVYHLNDQQLTPCGYDRVDVGAAEFSRFYLGGAPSVPPGQTLGECDGWALAKRADRCAADPVNTATGAFVHEVTDVSLPGIGLPFAFTRTYNSLDTLAGPLGPGWTHAYATSLTVKPSGDVTARAGDGQQVEFVKQGDGSYRGPAGAQATLTKPGTGYELVRHDQVKYVFDASGRLTSQVDRNGQGLTFAYDGNARLTTITDSASRTITLGYNASGLLASVTVPDGRSVAYAYTDGRLTSVTDVTGRVWTYSYDSYGFPREGGRPAPAHDRA